MIVSFSLKRRVFGALSTLSGCAMVLALIGAMNGLDIEKETNTLQNVRSMALPPPPPKKKEEKKKQKKRKKRTQKSKPRTSAPPQVLSAVGGLSFGYESLGDFTPGEMGDDLLGNTDNVVMTSDTVDVPPQCDGQPAPVLPRSAAKNGTTGRVIVNALVDATGKVKKTKVLESQPKGVFDQAVLDALKKWKCVPGRYQGKNVMSWARIPFGFRH